MEGSEELKEIKKVAELSEEEFKNKILKWFKDRGLLAELRSHLRYQMITFLRDTEIGNVLATTVPKTFSSKLRAVHFLISEFLLHSQHYYSLSVLVSEVPFLNVFPQMTSDKTLKVLQSPDSQNQIFRFQKDEVIDILQVLGITKRSYEETQILKSYLKSTEHALLPLILEILLEKTKLSESTDESLDRNFEVAERDNIGTRWNTAVQCILKNSFDRGSNIYAIKDRILRFFFVEFDRVKREAEEKCEIEIAKFKEIVAVDFKSKEILFQQELSNVEDKYQKQVEVLKEFKEEMETKFRKREKDFKLQLSAKEMKHVKELQMVNEHLNKKKKLIEKLTKDIDDLKTYRAKEHLEEIEQLKTEYKSVLQHLKNKYKKVIDKLEQSQKVVHDRENTIWELHQQMSKKYDNLNDTIEQQTKEIEQLKQIQETLHSQLETEKENTNLYQNKYMEQFNINKQLNQDIESYKQRLEDLNTRFEQFNNEFQKSIVKQAARKSSLTYCPRRGHKLKKSKTRKRLDSSDSSDTSSFPFTDIIKETQQRLEVLENTSKMIEETYQKNLQSLPQSTRPNLFQFVQNSLNSEQSQTKSDPKIDFKFFFDQIKEFNSNIGILAQISTSSVQKLNSANKTHVDLVEKLQRNSKNFQMKPVFREIAKNLELSFSQVEESMNDVSNVVENFVKNSTKLSEQTDVQNSRGMDTNLLINLGNMEVKSELEVVEENLLSINSPVLENLDQKNLSEITSDETEFSGKVEISQKPEIQEKSNSPVEDQKENFTSEEMILNAPESLTNSEDIAEAIDEEIEEVIKTVLNDENSKLIDLENYQDLKSPLKVMEMILETDEDIELDVNNEIVDQKVNKANVSLDDDVNEPYMEYIIEKPKLNLNY